MLNASDREQDSNNTQGGGLIAWLRRNCFALDLFLLIYFLFLLTLTLIGAAKGGRFTGELLSFLLPVGIGYFVFQRFALRYDRLRREASITNRKPPRWLTTVALIFFLSPLVLVPLSFLKLGKVMLDTGLVPSIEAHSNFDPNANYDPDHRTRPHPTESRDFLPYETDPTRKPSERVNYFLGPHGGATWWDLTLKNIDIALFGGTYPSEWVRGIQTPWLTGVMQLGYVFYYIAPPLACVPLLLPRRRRRKPGEGPAIGNAAMLSVGGPPDNDPPGLNLGEFRIATATLGGCILLTYFLYFAFPSTGPRFEGGIDAWMPAEPGWFFAQEIYLGIDGAEELRWDAFPSGHVAMSITCMLVALRFRRRIGLAMVVPVIALCLATVYMGYHYVIDVIGGIICAALTMAFVPRFAAWWDRSEPSFTPNRP